MTSLAEPGRLEGASINPGRTMSELGTPEYTRLIIGILIFCVALYFVYRYPPGMGR